VPSAQEGAAALAVKERVHHVGIPGEGNPAAERAG
jgi:hypothetical protein